jgi:octaprenyl-diphosphate synthase
MVDYPDVSRKIIEEILEERSRGVLEKFRKVTTIGFSNPELLSVIEKVNNYWKDSYRPALISLSYEAVGGKLWYEEKSSLLKDTSLVMSLIVSGMAMHDDIIDESEFKHGRVTIFKKKELHNALLIGDLLIIKGLITASEILRNKISIKKANNILETIQSFISDIYEGEFMEIKCRKNLKMDINYHLKYLWKFTADAGACAHIGSILGDGTENETDNLVEFARLFALNYFLKEELKDSLDMGLFSLYHRLNYESLPLPVCYLAKKTRDNYLKIETIINQPSISYEDSLKMKSICQKNDAKRYIYNLAKKNKERALKKIMNINPTPARRKLELMINQSLADIKDLQ